MSSLHSHVSLIQWCNALTVVDTKIRWDTNVLPGMMTLDAKFKWPSNCNTSRFVQDFLIRNSFKKVEIRISLSFGSLASIKFESRIIPRYSITVSGPEVLCLAIGILRVSAQRSTVQNLCNLAYLSAKQLAKRGHHNLLVYSAVTPLQSGAIVSQRVFLTVN